MVKWVAAVRWQWGGSVTQHKGIATVRAQWKVHFWCPESLFLQGFCTLLLIVPDPISNPIRCTTPRLSYFYSHFPFALTVSPPPFECLLTLLPIISQQSESYTFSYNNIFRLFNQTYMHSAINTSVVIDDILACVGCVHFTKCSSAPRQAKSGEQGRREQPRLINYSRFLCTTPLSAKGGMDAWTDG